MSGVKSESIIKAYGGLQIMHRIDPVAQEKAFLACDNPVFITGTEVDINSGMLFG